MAKDENDGRTVLMLAAASGSPDVFDAVASRLTPAEVSECARDRERRALYCRSYAVGGRNTRAYDILHTTSFFFGGGC